MAKVTEIYQFISVPQVFARQAAPTCPVSILLCLTPDDLICQGTVLTGTELSLVHTSEININITTYASTVSTLWSIEHFDFPKFERTHPP